MLGTRIFNPKCYTPPEKSQVTPCSSHQGWHCGSVPTGGHHGISNANGSPSLYVDRLGSRYRRIYCVVHLAECSLQPRGRPDLSGCGGGTHGEGGAGGGCESDGP